MSPLTQPSILERIPTEPFDCSGLVRAAYAAPMIPHREQWVAEMLLDAPNGVVDRDTLRREAPISGSLAYSDRQYANRKERGVSGARGSRAAEYVRRGIKELEREGFVRRDGDRVVLVDRQGLIDWLYEEDD